DDPSYQRSCSEGWVGAEGGTENARGALLTGKGLDSRFLIYHSSMYEAIAGCLDVPRACPARWGAPRLRPDAPSRGAERWGRAHGGGDAVRHDQPACERRAHRGDDRASPPR